MSYDYEKKNYTQSDTVTQAQQALQTQQAAKPGAYQSQYQQDMDDIMGQIQNRPKFQYDVNGDALYQQVAQNYIQQGRNAMMDTMGQAAALTGGYGNSYSQMAGQQTYQGYLQGLTDLVPEFRQMALDQYQMEGDELLNRYNLMMQQEESAYARYQDDLDRYYADLDRAQSAYDNERNYDMWLQEFLYGKDQDQKNWDYKTGQDEAAKQKENAEMMASVGDYSLLAAYYGLSEEQVKMLMGDQKTGSGGSGGSRGGYGGDTGGGGTSEAEWGPGIDDTVDTTNSGLKGSSYAMTKNTLAGLIRRGDSNGAAKYMDMIVDQLNEEQYSDLMSLFG